MKTKYILLVIGVLGIAASVYGIINDGTLTNNLTGLICGASLCLGYYELNKKE